MSTYELRFKHIMDNTPLAEGVDHLSQMDEHLTNYKNNSKQAFQTANSEIKKQSVSLEELRKGYTLTGKSIGQIQDYLKRLEVGQKKATDPTVIKKYNQEIARAKAAMKELTVTGTVGTAGMAAGATGATGAFRVLGASIKSALLPLAAAGAIVATLKGIVSLASDFEVAGSELSSLTGLTGTALEDLKQKAVETGVANSTMATDVIDAYKLIGSNSPSLLESAESLNEVTKNAIILKQAIGGGIELDLPADALTGTLNQFDLAASESSRVINVLAASSQKGSANITDLSETFKKSGTVLSDNNVSLELAGGLTETLAEKQIKGAEAGTNLRNITLKLANAGKGFIDGQFDMVAALEQTKTEFDNIKDPIERSNKLTKLFGLESVTAGGILLNNIDKVKSYTKAVTGTDIAQKQATTNTRNLRGAWERLTTTVQSLVAGNTEESGILTFLSYIVDGFRGLVVFIFKIVDDIKPAFSELFGVFGELFQTIANLFPKVDEGSESFDLLASVVKFVTFPLKALVELISVAVGAFKNWVDESPNFQAAITKTATLFRSVGQAIGLIPAYLEGSFDAVSVWTVEVIKAIGRMASNVGTLLKEAFNIGKLITGDTSGITNAVNNLFTNEFSGIGQKVADAYNEPFQRAKEEAIKNGNEIIAEAKKVKTEVDKLGSGGGLTDDQKKKAEEYAKFLKEREALRLSILEDGVEKQIALEEFKHQDLIQRLEKYNLNTTTAETKHQQNLFDIRKKFLIDDINQSNLAEDAKLAKILETNLAQIQSLEDSLGGNASEGQTDQISRLRLEARKSYITELEKLIDKEKNAELKSYNDQQALEILQLENSRQNGESLIEFNERKERAILEIKLKYANLKLKLATDTEGGDSAEALNLLKQVQSLEQGIADVDAGGGKEFNLLSFMGVSDENLGQYEEAIGQTIDLASQFFAEMNQARVDAAQEEIDIVNNQIDELRSLQDQKQSELDTEIENLELGRASKVNIKRQELADLQAEEKKKLAVLKKAENEKRAAQRAQLTADTVSQGVSLITASANIFKNFSAIPVIGVPLAITTIGAMFAAFASAKAKAFASIRKLEKGGTGVSGRKAGSSQVHGVFNKKRHYEGGEEFETEKGEGWLVLNRNITKKYGAQGMEDLYNLAMSNDANSLKELSKPSLFTVKKMNSKLQSQKIKMEIKHKEEMILQNSANMAVVESTLSQIRELLDQDKMSEDGFVFKKGNTIITRD